MGWAVKKGWLVLFEKVRVKFNGEVHESIPKSVSDN